MKRPTPPFVLADRTPLPLHVERLRSVPPPPSRWSDAVDTLLVLVVWGAIVACAMVLAAGAVIMILDALAEVSP